MFSSSKVVEELLSKSGAIGQEAAKAIADAAMLEVASTNVPHMVMEVSRTKVLQQILTAEYLQQSNGLSLCHFRPQMISMRELRLSILNRFALLQLQFSTWSKHMNPLPPLFLLSIGYRCHFLCPQILKGLEMESRMHIRFLDVDTTTMRCGKSTSWRNSSCKEMLILLLFLAESLQSLNGMRPNTFYMH